MYLSVILLRHRFPMNSCNTRAGNLRCCFTGNGEILWLFNSPRVYEVKDPQRIKHISHNVPFCNRNVQWALCDMGLLHCEIYATGQSGIIWVKLGGSKEQWNRTKRKRSAQLFGCITTKCTVCSTGCSGSIQGTQDRRWTPTTPRPP